MATYTVYRAPIPLYYDSYLAEQKSSYKRGTLTKTGTYTVLNSRQGADGVMLYGFDIGWIRDDDNIVPSTVPTVPDMQIDGSITVNINRVASNLTHQIEIKIGTTTIKKYDNVGTSCVVSFTTEEQNTIYGLLSDTTIGSMRVVCRTYLNGNQVGSYRATDGKLFVPASIVPKFGTNPTVTINKPINGKAYQNVSSLTVNSTNNIAGQGSSITSVTIQVGNFVGTTNPYTSSVISQSGAVTVKVTITDKRSRTATYTSSVNFEAYGGIKVDSFKGERKTPTSITYGLIGSYNVNVAIPTYKLETRIMGSPTWSVVRTGNVGGTSNTMVINGELTGLDASKTYELKMTVTDATGVPYVSFLTVATEAVTMSMGIHGASFGKLFDNSQPYNVQAGLGGIQSDGQVQINKNDNALQLKGTTRVFQEFFKSGVRKGYLGFAIPGSDSFYIANEAMNKNLELGTVAKYGGEQLLTASALSPTLSMLNGGYVMAHADTNANNYATSMIVWVFETSPGKLVNFPTSMGLLWVIKVNDTQLYQIFFPANTSLPIKRRERNNSGVWSAWA